MEAEGFSAAGFGPQSLCPCTSGRGFLGVPPLPEVGGLCRSVPPHEREAEGLCCSSLALQPPSPSVFSAPPSGTAGFCSKGELGGLRGSLLSCLPCPRPVSTAWSLRRAPWVSAPTALALSWPAPCLPRFTRSLGSPPAQLCPVTHSPALLGGLSVLDFRQLLDGLEMVL